VVVLAGVCELKPEDNRAIRLHVATPEIPRVPALSIRIPWKVVGKRNAAISLIQHRIVYDKRQPVANNGRLEFIPQTEAELEVVVAGGTDTLPQRTPPLNTLIRQMCPCCVATRGLYSSCDRVAMSSRRI